MDSHEFILLKSKSSEALQQIYSSLMLKNFYSRINIEDDFFQFWNMVSSMESIEFSDLDILLDVGQNVIQMPASVHSTVSNYFSVAFFEYLSKFQVRMNLEYQGYNTSSLEFSDKIELLDKYSEVFCKQSF